MADAADRAGRIASRKNVVAVLNEHTRGLMKLEPDVLKLQAQMKALLSGVNELQQAKQAAEAFQRQGFLGRVLWFLRGQ